MYDHHHSLDMGHPYSEIGNLISLKCQQGCWDRTRGSVHRAVGMGMGVGKGGPYFSESARLYKPRVYY